MKESLAGKGHLWSTAPPWPVCTVCGIVQRADGQNRPCKGPTRLREMEKSMEYKGGGK